MVLKLIRGINGRRNIPDKCLLTIGSFDGVHLGHQELLKYLYLEKQRRNLPSIVITFEPHPREFFNKNKKGCTRITRLREKLRYFSQHMVDYILCIRFNQQFASLTAEDFIKNILVDRLKVKSLVIGKDFRFGKNRQGNSRLLEIFGSKYGFNIVSPYIIYRNRIRVSSTKIRHYLSEDKINQATELLGHPFTLSGRVIHGKKLGRFLGFPTANLLLNRYNIPINSGVYIVEVLGLNKKIFPGIANIGSRPTVSSDSCQYLEVHLLGVNINMYGIYIDVIFHKKIRDEKKFTSLEKLKGRITKDTLIAYNFFRFYRRQDTKK